MIILSAKDLTKTYGVDVILQDVSFHINEGDRIGIIGANGAGKTTLLNCMAGLLRPQYGSIRLCGTELGKMGTREIAKIAGYVPQLHTPAFDYRVLDFVLMGRAPEIGIFSRPCAEEEQKCLEVLESMGLAHLAYKSYRNISGGERQQVMIARTLVQRPKVILFDEPTAHLDYGNQLRALSMVRALVKRGFGVIMTSHNPDLVLLLGGQVGILGNDGRFLVGNAEEVMTEERLRALYRSDLYLTYVERVGRKVCIPGRLKSDE